MKDYKLSEIKAICEEHVKDTPNCCDCPFVSLYGNCRWYFMDLVIPACWRIDDETDTKEN